MKWLAILLVMGYGSLFVAVPLWARRQLAQLPGASIAVGTIRFGVPCKLIGSSVVFDDPSSGVVVSARRIVLTPAWRMWRDHTLCLRTVELRGARVLCRRTPQGAFIWPDAAPSNAALAHPALAAPASPAWMVHITTLRFSNSILEFVDQKTPQPIRAALTDVSLVAGPVELPFAPQRIVLALQAQVLGADRQSAAIYCSGWLNPSAQASDLSCQLDPLRLAALEPYYRVRPARVYNATLAATGHFSVRNNMLDGRVQLEIGNLSEADLSFLRRPIEEAKRSGQEGEPALTGEVQVSGPLDDPTAWTVELAPGNLIVQRLLEPLLSLGIENIPVKVGERVINVELAPANQAVMSDIEAASKTVTQNLQVIAPPTVTPAPESSSVAPATVPATAPATPPAVPPSAPATQETVESGSVPAAVVPPAAAPSAAPGVSPSEASQGGTAVSPTAPPATPSASPPADAPQPLNPDH